MRLKESKIIKSFESMKAPPSCRTDTASATQHRFHHHSGCAVRHDRMGGVMASHNPVHIVSAWVGENQMVLAQARVGTKRVSLKRRMLKALHDQEYLKQFLNVL